MSTKIYDFVSTKKYRDRDKEVIKVINKYLSNNADALADGLVNDFIIFGNTNRERFYEVYKLNEHDWKAFIKANKGLLTNQVNDDLLYALLFTSYVDTRDRIFLDMLAIAEIGSKFHKYFKHGVSNPAKMKYVLENLSNKFSIKKNGGLFITVQDQITTIINSNARELKSKFSNLKGDHESQYIVNRISTSINGTMKALSKQYYNTNDKVLFTQTELQDDGNNISLTNNSVIISNLKGVILHYRPTNVDLDLLRALRINTPATKYICKKIYLDYEKKYMDRISNIYIDYFVKNFSQDYDEMKRSFITKSINGRLANDELKGIELEILEDTKKYLAEYQALHDDTDTPELDTNVEIVAFSKTLRNYSILKTRELMNKIH